MNAREKVRDERYQSMRQVLTTMNVTLLRRSEDLVFVTEDNSPVDIAASNICEQCFMCHTAPAYKRTRPFCMGCYCHIYRVTPDSAPPPTVEPETVCE